jgi:hypothetical protein
MDTNTLEDLGVRINVEVALRGPDGEIKQEELLHNLIPTVGKEAIAKLLKEGTTRPTHMAIGTGTEAAAAGDTKLKTELDRNAAAETSVTAKVFTMKAEWAAGDGTGAITEAGLLSAASEGTLFARAVFSVVNKGAEDTLTITWKITIE